MVFHGLLLFFYFALFNLLIYYTRGFQLRGFKPFVSVALFNLKFITGIFIWIIYTFYYKDIQNNDVHKFYNDALILRQAASENPKSFIKLIAGKSDESTLVYTAQMKNWERNFDEAPVNENRTIIKLNAVLMFLTGKTYLVHILFMCFFSLLGWVWIFNSIFDFAGIRPFSLSLVVLIFPSVLFWTSGVMKEPVLVFGLGVFMPGLFGLASGRNTSAVFKSISLLFIGTLILLAIKFYVLVCLLPAALSFLILPNQQGIKTVVAKYVILYIALLLIAFNVQFVFAGLNPLQMLVNKQTHAVKEAIYFNAGSRINIPVIDANALSVIKASPESTWNTIVRPYFWEIKRNPMMLASAIENAAVLLIIFISLCGRRKDTRPLNLIFFLLAFSLAYFALIGICTPVLGNLVRYKAPLIPFFMLAFLIPARKTFEEGILGGVNKKLSKIFFAS
jgi:hypothetical protein